MLTRRTSGMDLTLTLTLALTPTLTLTRPAQPRHRRRRARGGGGRLRLQRQRRPLRGGPASVGVTWGHTTTWRAQQPASVPAMHYYIYVYV